MVGALVAIAVAAAGAGYGWQHRARVPREPDLASAPAPLVDAIRGAEAQVTRWRHGGEGLAQLGRLYHANGYAAAAEACWQQLAARDPQNARWTYYLADLRGNASDAGGMAEFLQRTVALAPDYAPAWLKLAALELKTGQLDAAERDYQRRQQWVPDDPYAGLGLARIAQQRGDAARARALVERVVRTAPGFAPGHNLYAEMLAAAGDSEGARLQRFLGRLAGRFRDADDPWLEELQDACYDPAKLLVLASIDDMTNHGDHGVARLERARQIAPDDAAVYAQLGNAHLHLGDVAQAIASFEAGAGRPNATSELFANLSQAELVAQHPERALAAADRALARWPAAADALTARGNALAALGRRDAALAAYQRAAELAPNVCEMHYNLGRALLDAGQREAGLTALRRSLELDPTYARSLILLGETELDAGDLAAAETYVRPLYTLQPGLTSGRKLMTRWCLLAGSAAARDGQFELAEKRLREGLAISPELPELQARLGLLFAQQGRFAEARTPLETYHRLEPTEPMAALFLGQVYARLGQSSDARRLLTEAAQLARQTGDTATEAKARQLLEQ